MLISINDNKKDIDQIYHYVVIPKINRLGKLSKLTNHLSKLFL
jgi:hypothetical protein